MDLNNVKIVRIVSLVTLFFRSEFQRLFSVYKRKNYIPGKSFDTYKKVIAETEVYFEDKKKIRSTKVL